MSREPIINVDDLVYCHYGFTSDGSAYRKLECPLIARVISKSPHVFTVLHNGKNGSYKESFTYFELLKGETVSKAI